MFVLESDQHPQEELIRCARCRNFKPPDDFNWRRKALGQRDTYCRPCRADYKQEHYQANRERYIANAQARKDALGLERMTYLLKYFAVHPCMDCGETDPIVLDFDHQGDKLFNIAPALRYRNWESILAEIAKCEVVCSNCHRRRTAKQFDWSRLSLAIALGYVSPTAQAGDGN